jgi:fibronectin-binding autotransporter adhesin
MWMVSERSRRQTFPYSVGHGERGCVEMKEWNATHQAVEGVQKLAPGRLWEVASSTLGRVGVGLISLFALSAMALLLQQPAHAGESFQWTGEGHDGNWTNSCNWHPQGDCKETYPGKSASDDQAIIKRTASAPAHVALGDDLTVSSLSLEGEGVSLTGGHITVSNNLNWTGGSLDIDVTTGLLSFSNIDGPTTKVLSGNLTNNGILTQGSVPVSIGAGSKIVNNRRYSVSEGALINGMSCCVNAPRIVNKGRFVVSSPILPLPGSDQVTVDNVSFIAGGTVDTGDGVLELRSAPGQINVGTKFVGDGRFRITDLAEITTLGLFNVGENTEFELASSSLDGGDGVLLGTGTMDGLGNFLWTGGDVAGNLKLESGIQTYMDGPSTKDLSGTVTNQGRFVLQASDPTKAPTGQLRFGSRAKFNNNGIFIADERTGMVGTICCTLPASFNNTGQFSVRPSGTTTPGTVTVSNLQFKAGGSIHVERGTLEFRKGPGVLGPIDITGKGTLRVTDLASMALTGAFNLERGATFELGSCSGQCGNGQLVGEGTLGGGGRFKWTGGVIGESGNLTIADDSSMSISGPANKELKGTITNKGRATFVSSAASPSGPLAFVKAARFFNEGTFYAGDRSVFRATVCCVDPAKFVNKGNFIMDRAHMPGTGTASVENMVFDNRDTMELASGTLRFGPVGYTQFSGTTLLTGGSLSSGGPIDIRGGTLAGTGTLTGNLYNYGGTVSPGNPVQSGSTGILNVAGNYRQEPQGTLKVNLKGSTPGSGFDQLRVTEQAVLDGTLDLDRATSYTPGLTTKLKVLTMASRLGRFDRLQDTTLPNGREWYAVYGSHDVTLGVIKG